MRFSLAPDVHACFSGRDLVVLDLVEDSYLCLPEAIAPRAPARLSSLDVAAREALRASGWLGQSLPAPLPVTPAVRDLRDREGEHPGWRDLAAALGAWRELGRCGPQAPVRVLIAHLRGRNGGLGRDREATIACAARFAQVLPWLPVQGRCLQRSALLLQALARQGLTADWVFGVRTWPFRAHCWVQIDDVCLNDDVERLAAYAPILVV